MYNKFMFLTQDTNSRKNKNEYSHIRTGHMFVSSPNEAPCDARKASTFL